MNSIYRLIIPDFDQSEFLFNGNNYPFKFYTFSYYVTEDQGNYTALRQNIKDYTNDDAAINNDQITAYNTIYLFKEVFIYIILF